MTPLVRNLCTTIDGDIGYSRLIDSQPLLIFVQSQPAYWCACITCYACLTLINSLACARCKGHGWVFGIPGRLLCSRCFSIKARLGK